MNAPAAEIALPIAPAFVIFAEGGVMLSADGELSTLSAKDAARRLPAATPLLASMPAAARRLKIKLFPALDLLELYAFVRPARFCLPTLDGLAEVTGLAPAGAPPDPMRLWQIAEILLGELTDLPDKQRRRLADLAAALEENAWPWGGAVVRALGTSGRGSSMHGLDAWTLIPEVNDGPGPSPPGAQAVTEAEARERLGDLLGPHAEHRKGQFDYAGAVAHAFAPRERRDEPQLVLAEAGTGTGKTMGYVAPASLWAEKNDAAVWISTYTRNLQRQLDQELDRLYPDPAVKARKAVIRKGRENYLCLLNFQEAVQGGAAQRADMAPLAMMARWIEATRDGDLGGDFPSWLTMLYGRARTTGLADRRGECVYSACEHYRKCFIENARRKSMQAEIVVANHALVLARAVRLSANENPARRYVFDEGHHLFDAADSAFSAELSGMETRELRRWIRGGDGGGGRGGGRSGGRNRARALTGRVQDLIADDEKAKAHLDAAVHAARHLPGPDWQSRLREAAPKGPAEVFLARVRQQVLARTPDADAIYDLECETGPPVDGMPEAAKALAVALAEIRNPLLALQEALLKRLGDETSELASAERVRMEASVNGIDYRCKMVLKPWIAMLRGLGAERPEGFVDWFSIRRFRGQEIDAAYHRHMTDPTEAFAETVLKPAHGAVITSASLRDRSGVEDEDDWLNAEIRTGARHLVQPARRLFVPSPFDYAANTRIFVVKDVNRQRADDVAAAFRELFLAANGGAIGLFTAIRRLRLVYERLVGPLEERGLPLYAQHVDPIDTPTLVDIFRAERNSCLLGSDAVRDGVDVPGNSLRMIVFDRTPWPRPDILHKARRKAFGGARHDDMLVRLKLKQAFGRLLRRQDDRGVFVLLDSRLPSRLCDAFPAETEISRLGIAETINAIRSFLDK